MIVPLPKPTLSPFARGYLSLCRFFTAAVWCVPALRLRVPFILCNLATLAVKIILVT